MTSDEQRQFNAHLAEADEAKAGIEQCEADEQRMARLDEHDRWGNSASPALSAYDDGIPVAGADRRASKGGAGKAYRQMFPGANAGNDGFKHFGEFLSVLHSQRHDGRLRASMTVGTDSGGGFLVPDQFAAQVLDKSLENEIVRSRCQVHPMTSDTLKIGGFDSLDHSSNLSGFTAEWVGEEGTPTLSAGKVRQVQLKAKKLFLLAPVSNELTVDAPDFERTLGDALIQAVGWHLDYACLNGTGAGQPLGVLNDPALIEVAADDGQPASTIKMSNLNQMMRMHPACFANSVWVANPTTIPELLSLQYIRHEAASVYLGDHYEVL